MTLQGSGGAVGTEDKQREVEWELIVGDCVVQDL